MKHTLLWRSGQVASWQWWCQWVHSKPKIAKWSFTHPWSFTVKESETHEHHLNHAIRRCSSQNSPTHTSRHETTEDEEEEVMESGERVIVRDTDIRRLVWKSPPTGHCCPVRSSPLPVWNWTWCRHVCPLLCILHDWGAADSWWREGGHSCGDDHGRELPIDHCSLPSVLQEHIQQVGWRRRRISGCSNPLRGRGVGFREGK